MNTLQLNSFNADLFRLGYNSKHIRFEDGKGYTSDLMQNLFKHGWQSVKSGAIHILKDDEGHQVTTAGSWVELLYNTAKVMR